MIPTLTISIDRSDMAGDLDPLILSGTVDANVWGISAYQDPALQTRVTYAGDSQWLHGSLAISAVWQQSLLAFDVFPTVANEAAAAAAVAELTAAISRLTFTVTVDISDAAAVVWRADFGSLSPAPRQLEDDLDMPAPAYTVTIPVYPIPVT